MAELPEEPNPSEGLLASWGRRLLAALRSMRLRAGPGIELRQDSEGTTVLLAKPPPDPNRERPFRARFMRASGTAQGEDVETGLFIYLPPETAEAVRWKGNVVPPAASQDLGTSENPWVEFDAGEGGKVYIEITFARQTGTGMSGELEPTEWKLAASASAASDEKWYHLVCAVEEDIGLVQYHLGSLLLGCTGEENECPDVYSVTKQTGTLPSCVAARYVFKRQYRERGTNGECQDRTGTGSSETTNIDIPAPPEISASATGYSGSGRKAGTITVAACDGTTQTIDVYNGEAGEDGTDGCSPEISVTVLEPGSSQGGEAGGYLITVTNRTLVNGVCTPVEPILTFVVHNGVRGEDGEDGCSPVVASASGTDADGRRAVCTIQGRIRGANGCENDGNAFTVYDGKDGKDGAVCGSFAGFAGMKFENGALYYGTQAYQFALNSASGCYEPQATGGVVWTAVSGLDFYTCTPSS